MKKFSLLPIAAILFCTLATAQTSSSVTFDQEQTAQIEKIVHSYLVAHPEVLIEASQALMQKKIDAEKDRMIKWTAAHPESVLQSKYAPVAGNPKGPITLVEFFDYQCPHCREMGTVIDQLIQKNPDLRVVFRNFPLYGNSSLIAAKASVAAYLQNKYWPFHQALFIIDPPITENSVMATAKKVGIDINQLQKDWQGDFVKQSLQDDFNLVKSLQLNGTPEFIVTNTAFKADGRVIAIPGTSSEEELQKAINEIKKED